MAVLQLLALSGLVASARGSGYGGGGFPPPMASYGAPVAPVVPQAQAYPIYDYDYDYDYYDDSFGGFFKGLSKGMSSLMGGGKGGGGGGGGKKPPKIVQIPVPQHVPPPPKPQVVHVKVPKCEPEVHYVTKYVNEKVPVPVAHTEFVDRVVPTVVYQTEYQKLKETEFVTHVLTQLVTSTYTKSIVVPRKTYITQTYTSVVTRNILQRTTEVSYTPVVKTNQVTVTQTAVRVEQVPDIRYTTVERTRPVVSTAYVTETKLKLQPSVVFKTQYETRTQVSTQYVPRVSTVYGPPQTLTSTAYQHVTSSIYAPAPAGGGSGPVTITQQLKEYVPTVKTQYVTSTVVRKEYVTVTPKCPSGGGYGYSPPVQLGSYSEHEEQKVDLAGVAAPAAVAAPQVAAAAAAPLQQAVAVAFHQDSAGVSPASFGVPLPFSGAGAGGAGGAFPHVTQIVGKNYSLR